MSTMNNDDREAARQLIIETLKSGPKTCDQMSEQIGLSSKSIAQIINYWKDKPMSSVLIPYPKSGKVLKQWRLSDSTPIAAPVADPIALAVANHVTAETQRITQEEVTRARDAIAVAVQTARSNVRQRVAAMFNMPGLQLDLSHIDIDAMLKQAPARCEASNESPIKPVESKPQAPEVVSKAEPTAPKKTDRKPKLVIVGLHQNKQELIKREFRDKFDLRIFNPDQITWIAKAINHGDNVLCLADYISHKHTECVQAAGGKMMIVRGGMSGLRAEIYSILEDEKVAA